MAVVTEKWSQDVLEGARRAVRVFEVSEVASKVEAAAAAGVPQLNEPHPDDSSLAVRERPRVARLNQSDFYSVTVVYSTPAEGPEVPDPATGKGTWKWDFGTRNEQVDRDRDGNAVVNSARQGFDPPSTAPKGTIFLEYVKQQPLGSFDPALAAAYNHAVCSDGLTIEGVPIVGAGGAQVRIAPDQAYKLDTPEIQVRYVFEIRTDAVAFKHRIKDAGTMGVASDPNELGAAKVVQIYTRDNPPQPVTEPVPLNGAGAPYDLENFQLGADDWPPFGAAPPAGAVVDDTGDAAWLVYELSPSLPFSALGL